MTVSSIKVLQVSNISPSATSAQVKELFSYIGEIDDCRVYPFVAIQDQPRFAYIQFDDDASVEVGQHLTNITFVDRPLVCVPITVDEIPDEETALKNGLRLPVQRKLPRDVSNTIQKSADGEEMLFTNDPTLSDLGLPKYPPLPADTEASKVEEIRRTVYIGNLEKEFDGEAFMEFLTETIGEVMYLRMAASNAKAQCGYAYVEFFKQESIHTALQNDGIEYNGRPLKIQHSRVAIVKPRLKTVDQALEEVEEVIQLSGGQGDNAKERNYLPVERGPPPVRRRSPRRRTPSVDEKRSHHSKRRSHSKSKSKSEKRSHRSKSPRKKRSHRSKSPRKKRKHRSKSPGKKKHRHSKSSKKRSSRHDHHE